MSDMNQFLAQYYGTTAGSDDTLAEKTASEQAQEEANLELFAKIAHENGIDLEKLSEDQLLELYNATFSEKTAEEEGEKKESPAEEKAEKKDEKDEDEKKAAAEAEFTEKKAAAEKIAEADFLGRVMAHAYVNEMRKIASAAETGEEKEAADLKVRTFGDKLRSAAHHAKETAGKASDKAKELGGKAKEYGGRASAKAKELGGKASEHVKSHKTEYAVGGAGAAGAAAGAAGGYALGKHRSKEASALDELAIERAVEMVHAFNKEAGAEVYDLEVVAARIDAVDTLGLQESVKVASAASAEQAVEVRALEFLEAAGLPITWAE